MLLSNCELQSWYNNMYERWRVFENFPKITLKQWFFRSAYPQMSSNQWYLRQRPICFGFWEINFQNSSQILLFFCSPKANCVWRFFRTKIGPFERVMQGWYCGHLIKKMLIYLGINLQSSEVSCTFCWYIFLKLW